MEVYLVCRDHRLFERPVPLAARSRYIIGRALECELYVKDRSVSRQHAEVSPEGRRLKVRDLGSMNGTYLDNSVIAEATAAPGQVLRVGRVEFLVTDNPKRDRWPGAPEDDESTAPLSQFDQRRTTLLQTLSEAQRRVTLLLLEGMSEKEVASRLRLSPHTVHNHIKEIYRRLEVNSRAELLALFLSKSPPSLH